MKHKHLDVTEYLAHRLARDEEAKRQALSLINEPGYGRESADRLHEWVDGHMMVFLSSLVVSNPYPSPWPTWIKDILTDALHQVDWNELVNTLKGGQHEAR